MKYLTTMVVMMFSLVIGASEARAEKGIEPQRWADYLDFAYVYTSADSESLSTRLDQYGAEAGISLDDYLAGYLGSESQHSSGLGDEQIRRKAIGFLLQYLATPDPTLIDRSAETISKLWGDSPTLEDRYWYHYIQAHRAMEKLNATEFVRQNLEMWTEVVVPMESMFDTFDTLSLSQSANSGFVAALPYVFENVSRLILIRSQEMGLNRELDPLEAIVRLLHANRVGSHPDVIPDEASSIGYLDRIIARLDGPESDAGSLTFTLALFEAGKYHDRARSLLADQGFAPETLKAIEVTSGAYQIALSRATTAQGKIAVHVRVLRQLGEIYAAKQRLGMDPPVAPPFGIEGAIALYDELQAYREKDDWIGAGYERSGRESFVTALRTLWEEIQEASLNGSDYYLSRGLAEGGGSDGDVRSAAQMYDRYLSFFKRYAASQESEFIPNSAYFAAYEASKGHGDALLLFARKKPTPAEAVLVAQRYLTALRIYPLDRSLWSAVAKAVDLLGRPKDYLGLVRPLAERVTRSRHVDAWIENKEPGFETVDVVRSALSDDLVLMYLGFASRSGVEELQESLDVLEGRRDAARKKLSGLTGDGPGIEGPGPASPGAGPARPLDTERQIAQTRTLLARLEHRIDAMSRALPLYIATQETHGLIEELRPQRGHAAHTLLRRLYYEKGS